ncbi:General secretion pathway protein C [hydrothermal vent metagenome]|uniref:General secretion pathway protein C n=1 Tax=hydrothermal vent metagenome TaxID=652676 RepID=A0A3B1C9S2_9ZZZZ
MATRIKIPKKWWTAIHLLLLATTAWVAAGTLGKLFANRVELLAPPAVTKKETATVVPASINRDYSYILRRNIFNSQKSYEGFESTQSKTSSEDTKISGTDAPKTSLKLKLLGTVVDPDGQGAFAVIENSSGTQQLYRLSDIVGGAKIVKIERNRTLLNHNGKVEALEVDFTLKNSSSRKRSGIGQRNGNASSEVSRISEGEYLVSKQYLASQMSNMNRLLTQVRAVPNLNKSGAANGFKLFSIKRNSIFAKLGLRNRDVIQRINGVELNSAEKGLELFQALRSETSFEVDLIRNSQKTTLRFNIQ